jgi:hypothetical protein
VKRDRSGFDDGGDEREAACPQAAEIVGPTLEPDDR